ncbi:hypothetical protein [Methyloglobulus sp.]|uniref:hypothetical protein n=1 Tax=Methyloglobulus sp. TaxID=2518622 RepID=UPI0032B7876A
MLLTASAQAAVNPALPQIREFLQINVFKASVIHEFGHIIGMSHEQNRSDDPYSILKTCSYNDFDRTPFGTTVIGNIKISAQAAVNPPVSATPKAKAFYRDDQIWPTTNIPVCWENLSLREFERVEALRLDNWL